MSYVVLARKWRPQTFADLTGQDHVATTLTNAIIQDRVPHALLFTGARGVGKTSSARILAMALNCATGPTPSPCGTCDACTEIQKGQSVDVLEIDGASNRGINEIRELRDGVRYAPNRDRFKIYIIDEVHMLTTEAFNALLKTLEEPPKHVVFIFATTEAQKIPVTILSRCQRFDFRRISHADIVRRLSEIAAAESLVVEPDALGLVARQAAGGMRDALSLMDQLIAFSGTTIRTSDAETILGAAERRRLFRLSQALVDRDIEAALQVVDELDAFGVDVAHFSMELVSHLRDLAIVAVARDPSTLVALTDAELSDARGQVARTDVSVLHRMFELMVDAAESIARSNHPRLLLEMALVRLTAIEPGVAIEALIARLEALAGGAPPPAGSGSGAPPAGGSGSRQTPPAVAGAAGASQQSAGPTERPPLPVTAAPATPAAVAQLSSGDDAPLVADRSAAVPTADVLAGSDGGSARPASTEAATETTTEPAPAAPHTAQGAPPTEALEAALSAPLPAPAGAAGAGAMAALTRTEWRAVVNEMRDSRPHAGELLANARVVALDGRVELGLADGMFERVSDDVLAHLNHLCQSLGGASMEFRKVPIATLDTAAAADAYHVATDEAAERVERQRAAERYVEQHETTRRLLAQFPGCRVQSVTVTQLFGTEERA
ncbi:MAG: DNA polymerase III subunit gamma/tau [Myxococcales bacterium]|nr:DNA polymerase III subunit gamma/tau [Myxococcales bacterium]MCB9521568.1 DNA polymerase III subunit gamma/tau [Myxococcales bacterium]MCB9530564.1 DNA polymerase III subunit gamma/tau [Myxococcales bacterium]MCB9534487.1 DNA polymerase III subunit gamma/tau [Myxococcales bacterium]